MEGFEIRVDDDIVLRLHQEKVASLLFELVEKNRTHFREWLPWLDVNTKIEDTKKFIAGVEDNYKKGLSLNLGIYYQDKIIGALGFNVIENTNKKAEIGYVLDKDSYGNGIMTKSCKALINYGFNELDLNRIEIKAAVENTKSRAIPERLGFKQEGILQQGEFLYDHFVDVAVYGMLKENWK
ncbi:MAG: GNAT family N-acetyltransferase [Flavobacteriales bacterium]|nr:GNAT family N-acetyltransferase [Flavobacteriales bacterium]